MLAWPISVLAFYIVIHISSLPSSPLDNLAVSKAPWKYSTCYGPGMKNLHPIRHPHLLLNRSLVDEYSMTEAPLAAPKACICRRPLRASSRKGLAAVRTRVLESLLRRITLRSQNPVHLLALGSESALQGHFRDIRGLTV